jgi:GT2 family glycosyltransferase
MNRKVAVGFVPRERFSSAPESLGSIIEHTDPSIEILVVDCNIPPTIWRQIEAQISRRENVRVLRADEHLLPNEARNLVAREVSTEYLCLIENDNLVAEGWLETLCAACDETSADVAAPLLMEGRPGTSKVHFDDNLGSVLEDTASDGKTISISPRTSTREMAMRGRQLVDCLETHCLLFRTQVFERLGSFDERMNTSEEVDLSLALKHVNAPIVFEPACKIHYVLPTYPLPDVDRSYFMKKWDLEQARESHRLIKEKWKLSQLPQIIGFVEERFYRGTGLLGDWAREIAHAKAPETSAIVVGIDEFENPEIFDSVHALPFTERNGEFWGAPADDVAAISELERLKDERNASLLVFLWSNFWQLDYYRKFGEHVRRHYERVINNDHLIAFDLTRMRGAEPKAT